MLIFTRTWWAAAGSRATATVTAALIPLVGVLFAGGLAPVQVLSLSVATGVASLFTSLAGLPEVSGRAVTLWRAITARCAKTFGQTAVVMFVGVTAIEAVDWRDFGITVGGAVAVTLLRTVAMYLPETDTTDLDAEAEIQAAVNDHTVWPYKGEHEA